MIVIGSLSHFDLASAQIAKRRVFIDSIFLDSDEKDLRIIDKFLSLENVNVDPPRFDISSSMAYLILTIYS